MIAALATLVLGMIIGYVGQRSRLCFVSGYRDWIITRDATMLKGVGGTFIGAVGGFLIFGALGGTVPAYPLFRSSPLPGFDSGLVIIILCGLTIGILGVLTGGCPFRMHVLAAEGRRSCWYYLLGFYLGIIFYNLLTSKIVDLVGNIR